MLERVELLEESFDLLSGRGAEVVSRMYTRLFEMEPGLCSLFERSDLGTVKAMMLGMLIILRRSLRNIDSMAPMLEALGAHHQDYGVRNEDYGTMGVALLEAIAEVGGADWKPAYTAAWAEAYAVLWGMIVNGSRESAPAATAEAVLVA